MCLAIPGQIQSIEGSEMERTGKVRFGGVVKSIMLACVPEAKVGDYVMVHAGFAISVVDEKEALETLKYLAAMGAVSEIQ
jgi:hydrogenase expression/formation protein HypC